jgi:hypothetical protein
MIRTLHYGLMALAFLVLPKAKAMGPPVRQIKVAGDQVPAVVQPYLQKLLGNYEIFYNAVPKHIVGHAMISMVHGKMQFMPTNFDLLDPNCTSRVGDLAYVQYYEQSAAVMPDAPVRAWFWLNPGRCVIQDRFVEVSFNRTLFGGDHFEANIVVSKRIATSHGGFSGAVTRRWILEKIARF